MARGLAVPSEDVRAPAAATNGASAAKACDWVHFAARTGEAGRAWAAEYRTHLATVDVGEQALELLHRHRFEEGRAMLEDLARRLEELGDIPPSMRSIMNRWYHGALGYYFYSVGDFERARHSIEIADQSVAEAISDAGFLTPMAVDGLEFALHKARIARNGKRWTEMRAHLEHAKAMTLDQQPLCRTRQGQPIYFWTLHQFYTALEPLSPAERDAIWGMDDPDQRAVLFDKFVRRLLMLPGFALKYP